MKNKLFISLLLLLSSCQSDGTSSTGTKKLKGEYLQRKRSDLSLVLPPHLKNSPPTYPWQANWVGNFPRITKDFFRCRGSLLNPPRAEIENGETVQIDDCGGAERHSLPLQDGQEFIYPILIDLMNYLQQETDRRIVITSGHRCPQHNRYVDSSPFNRTSKHQIGAEVSFYVHGLEEEPEKVIQLILRFYQNHAQQEYRHFERYAKGDTNTSTLPWYNKEIFLKLFKKDEGRNLDNRHPYPYLAIQVRYDPVKKCRIIYSWEQSYQNYLKG